MDRKTIDISYKDKTIVLFSVICNQNKDIAWKSKSHHDPNITLGDGKFIAGVDTAKGSVQCVCDIDKYWDYFEVKEISESKKLETESDSELLLRLMTLSSERRGLD